MYVSADDIKTVVAVVAPLLAILGFLSAQLTTQDKRMDKRFEQMDKRFERMDKRFEQMDKRFERIDARLDRSDERMERLELKVSDLGEDVVAIKGQIFKSDVYEAVATQLRAMSSPRPDTASSPSPARPQP